MATKAPAWENFDLLNLPSIDNVFLANRAVHLGAKVSVTDTRGLVFELSIKGVQHEDGSGRSLLVKGWTRHPILKTLYQYEAWLNYKGGGRKGWIKFLN